jgi:glycosyltransferase involved in cell wall biosynthesis
LSELQTPFVTVMMPVRNEANFIARSLGAVLEQDYPPERMEIFVIDGMSTDDTRQIVQSFSRRDQRVRLLDNPGKIAPAALNVGLRQAGGEVVVRVDGHCEISTDYVRLCVEHLREQNVDGVGGPIETIGETTTAQAIALSMSTGFGVGGSAFRTGVRKATLVDTIAFPAYTRAAIERVGYFDEELVRNQDDEYNFRLRKLGGRLLLSPDICSRYYSRCSLSGLWRQYWEYGYWKVRVMQRHPFQMSLRQFVPAAFVAALILTLACSPLSVVSRWAFAVIVFTYLIANLTASVLTARRGGGRLLLYLPAAFATLHLSYGLGFLLGLVRFRHLWDGAKETRATTRVVSEPAER